MVKAAKNTKKPGREVATLPKGGAVVTGSAAKRMREDAAKASHGFQAKDMAVPFLRIVEPLSGLMKTKHADYNPDAEAGDIYNSATEKLTPGDEGIIVIPCHFVRRFTRWGLIDSKEGGGFKADYGTEYDLAKKLRWNLWIGPWKKITKSKPASPNSPCV